MAEEYSRDATAASSTVAYLCPNCRAGLSFDPASGRFACEFCLSDFSEEELSGTDAAAKAKAAEEAGEDFCAHMNDYICPNCGAEIIADETTAADFCCYCHNPIVLQGKLVGQMKPDKVVPFEIDREDAKRRFLGWARKRLFAPRDFTAASRLEKMQGVYYPFWVTDADTDAEMTAHATRVRSWRSGNRLYTETSNFLVERSGEIHFEDISTSALSEADKKMLEGVLPYESNKLIPFTSAYLSGFVAKKRDIERKAVTDEVRGRMNMYANELLRGTIKGYNTVSVNQCKVQVYHSNWDYTLFPIWMLIYRGKKKDYTFALNGSTGKIYGEVPISRLKLWLFGAVIFAVAFGLAWLAGGAIL